MKKKVAIFTSTEGHLSIAEALEEKLQASFEIVNFVERDPLFYFYQPLYRFFPSAGNIPYKFAKNSLAKKGLLKMFLKTYKEKIDKFYKLHQPDICINTYFMFNQSLEQICSHHGTFYINVLTDPRSLHEIIISPFADINCALDKKLTEHCQNLHPSANYTETGWFVRQRFEEAYDKKAVRETLGIPEKNLTFLIASGAEGSTLVMKILPSLIRVKKPVRIFIACGTNELFYKAVKSLARMFRQLNSPVELIALPFTKDIHRYMQAADLVIGKAGPNMLFESVATHTPFFAVTHIAGQEDGNLDLIREENLGFVEENPLKAIRIMKNIINHPEQLEEFQSSLQTLAEYNKQSGAKLKKLIDQKLQNT